MSLQKFAEARGVSLTTEGTPQGTVPEVVYELLCKLVSLAKGLNFSDLKSQIGGRVYRLITEQNFTSEEIKLLNEWKWSFTWYLSRTKTEMSTECDATFGFRQTPFDVEGMNDLFEIKRVGSVWQVFVKQGKVSPVSVPTSADFPILTSGTNFFASTEASPKAGGGKSKKAHQKPTSVSAPAPAPASAPVSAPASAPDVVALKIQEVELEIKLFDESLSAEERDLVEKRLKLVRLKLLKLTTSSPPVDATTSLQKVESTPQAGGGGGALKTVKKGFSAHQAGGGVEKSPKGVICIVCKTFVPYSDLKKHNSTHKGHVTCRDCGECVGREDIDAHNNEIHPQEAIERKSAKKDGSATAVVEEEVPPASAIVEEEVLAGGGGGSEVGSLEHLYDVVKGGCKCKRCGALCQPQNYRGHLKRCPKKSDESA